MSDSDNKADSNAGNSLIGTETILFVEDEADIRTLADLALSRLGYRVICAQGPLEAIDIVEAGNEPIDLLITDVEMPNMFGDQLANQLRHEIQGLKVLFISGYRSESLDAVLGNEQFLAKPFTLSALATSVRSALAS